MHSTAGGRSLLSESAWLDLHGLKRKGLALQPEVVTSERVSRKGRLWTGFKCKSAAGILLPGAKHLCSAAKSN